MMKRTLAQAIAVAVEARANCVTSGNADWQQRWAERLEAFSDLLPSGSGFDNGTVVDIEASNANRLVLHTSFHHMNDGGMYDGWTEHTVRVWPTFDGFRLTIGGRDRNDIKEYIGQIFHDTLSEELADPMVAAQ